MITVRLHEDQRRIVLEADEVAEVVVEAIAAEQAEDPEQVAAMLTAVNDRRRYYEGLASLEEAHDLPEELVQRAAAARDAFREAFVAALSEPIEYALTFDAARRLSGDLAQCAAQTTTARIREGVIP